MLCFNVELLFGLKKGEGKTPWAFIGSFFLVIIVMHIYWVKITGQAPSKFLCSCLIHIAVSRKIGFPSEEGKGCHPLSSRLDFKSLCFEYSNILSPQSLHSPLGPPSAPTVTEHCRWPHAKEQWIPIFLYFKYLSCGWRKIGTLMI